MKKLLKSTLFFIAIMVNIPLVLADSSFITVYENIGYGGQSQVMNNDIFDFSDSRNDPTHLLTLANDRISSISVPPGCVATLYEHAGYSGTSETFFSSDFDLQDNVIGNDRASSARITCGNGSIRIFPPTSELVVNQNFDLVIMTRLLANTDLEVVEISHATLDFKNITEALKQCVIRERITTTESNKPNMGEIFKEGVAFKCAPIPAKFIGVGKHSFNVTIKLSDGSWLTDRVEWNILAQ